MPILKNSSSDKCYEPLDELNSPDEINTQDVRLRSKPLWPWQMGWKNQPVRAQAQIFMR